MSTTTAPERAPRTASSRPTADDAPPEPTLRDPAPRAPDRPLRRRLRPLLFWLHLAAGSLLGLVILTQALTGISIAYRRQIVDGVVAAQVAPVPAGAVRLPLDTLMARAAATGQRPTGVTLRHDANAPVVVQFDGRRTAALDPYTGRVLPGAPRLETFFAYMEGVHRWFAFTGHRGPLGEATTSVSVLGFFGLLLSGLYLWIPARWTRRSVRAVALVNRGARGRARDWNWHHVAGLWASPIILVVTVTGVFMAFDWPGRWLAHATGSPVPAAEGPQGPRAPTRETPSPTAPHQPRPTNSDLSTAPSPTAPSSPAPPSPPRPPRASLDTLVARALQAVPGPWYAVQLRLPGGAPRGGGPPGGPRPSRAPKTVTATITGSANLRPDLRTQLTLDPATGAIQSRQDYAGQDVARRLRSWMHPVHSGEGFGILGESIAVLSALATATLVWTGLALALRRLRTALRRSVRTA